MTTDARESLRHLTAALEAHLEAIESRRSAEDAVVDDAFEAVAEAFERYEDALDSTFGEALPIILDIDDDDDDDDDRDDDADFDDDQAGDLDPHAAEDEDGLDDDIEAFDLR